MPVSLSWQMQNRSITTPLRAGVRQTPHLKAKSRSDLHLSNNAMALSTGQNVGTMTLSWVKHPEPQKYQSPDEASGNYGPNQSSSCESSTFPLTIINTILSTLTWFQINAAVAKSAQTYRTRSSAGVPAWLVARTCVKHETSEKTAWRWTLQNRTMENAAPCSWGHVPAPICTHLSLKPALKALELLAPGNANARTEITALSEIMGGSSKCCLYSLSGECGGLVEECVKDICVPAYVCWPRVKSKRFLIENSHPGAGCWKLWPALHCWQSLRSALLYLHRLGEGALVEHCHT